MSHTRAHDEAGGNTVDETYDVLVVGGGIAGLQAALEVAAAGDPTFMKSHLELGKCYLELGKLEESLKSLSRAAELAPLSWEPHSVLAQVYGRLNDREKQKAELAVIDKLRRERDQRVKGAMEKVVQQEK